MSNHCIASNMKILWFALVAAVMVEARPELEKTTKREVDLKVSSESEPRCISNFQPCLDSIKPCCQPENRIPVPFGHEEFICDRFLGGLCAPLIVVTNLPLYLELSRRMNETNLSELSNLYWADVFATPEVKPESKIEDGRNVEETNELNTNSIELRATYSRKPVPEVSSTCIENYQRCVNADQPCCSETQLYGGSSKLRKFVCDTDRRGICVPFYGWKTI